MKQLLTVCSVLLLLLLWQNVFTYKILIYSPRIGIENVKFMGRIADEFVKAGHDVVVYLPVIDSSIKINGSKLAKLIQDKLYSSMYSVNSVSANQTFYNIWTAEAYSFWELLTVLQKSTDIQLTNCIKQLNDYELLERLKSENFDFAITELINFCGFALFNRLGIEKYACASITDTIEVVADTLGVSSNPSYIPATISYDMSDKMNFLERLINYKAYLQIYFIQHFLLFPKIRRRLNNHLPNQFDFPKAIRGSSLGLINSDEFIQFQRLNGPKIVFIGGITLNEPKPLEKEYQTLMDQAKNGIVLVSFDTSLNIDHILSNINDSLIKIFKHFPKLTFLLNYETDNDFITDKIPNIIKKNWIPQEDLLAHANLLALITCCDSNTIMQAAYAGVPLICIPFSAEQMRNSRIAEHAKIAIVIKKLTLTGENLANALDNIIHSNIYKMKVRKLAGMMRDKPISVRERLIGQVEYAIKFGPLQIFDVAYNDLYLYQYHLLDIILPIILLSILICYYICRLMLSLFRRLFSKSKTKLE